VYRNATKKHPGIIDIDIVIDIIINENIFKNSQFILNKEKNENVNKPFSLSAFQVFLLSSP